MYQAIDPVFPPNYYRMAQIFIMRQQYDQAIKTYEDLIAANQCAVDPGLLTNDLLRHTILSYQHYTQENGQWVHRHAVPQEPAAAAEAYTSLANAHYLAGHLQEAEKGYKTALGLVPTFDNAKRNLEVVYRKAQLDGRLRKLPPPAKMPGAGEPPFTGYEVAPAKK